MKNDTKIGRQTDRQTDQTTDVTSYRCARTNLQSHTPTPAIASYTLRNNQLIDQIQSVSMILVAITGKFDIDDSDEQGDVVQEK